MPVTTNFDATEMHGAGYRKATQILFAKRLSIRLEKPGVVFCSIKTSGVRDENRRESHRRRGIAARDHDQVGRESSAASRAPGRLLRASSAIDFSRAGDTAPAEQSVDIVKLVAIASSWAATSPRSRRRVPTYRTSVSGRSRISSSPSATAGNRWPPVPPPAMINLSDVSRANLHRYFSSNRGTAAECEQRAERRHRHHDRGAAVAQKRQRQSLGRNHPDHHRHVDERLQRETGGKSYCE